MAEKKSVPAGYVTLETFNSGKMGDKWQYFFTIVGNTVLEIILHNSRLAEVVIDEKTISFNATELVKMQKPEGFFPNFQVLGFYESKA